MARRLTPLGLLVKWLVVPVALGTAGYFLVGPEIGKSPMAKKAAARIGLPVLPPDEKPKGDEPAKAAEPEKTKRGPEPEVEVSSEPVQRKAPERRRRRRRRRTTESRAQILVPESIRTHAASC